MTLWKPLCSPLPTLQTWNTLSQTLHKSGWSSRVWGGMGWRWRWRRHRGCKPACQSNCSPRTLHTAFQLDHTWTWDAEYSEKLCRCIYSIWSISEHLYPPYPVIDYGHCSKYSSNAPWCHTCNCHDNRQYFTFGRNAHKSLNTENSWGQRRKECCNCDITLFYR